MSDFPATLVAPPKTVLSVVGGCSLLGDFAAYTGLAVPGTATWPAANRAIYVPIWTELEVTVTTFAFQVVIQSGNLDVGIYDEKGNRIVSKGSTAVGAAGVQAVDLTASVTGTASPVLLPGIYFLAMCVDNTTASFNRVAPTATNERVCGVQQEALGSVTLGDPANFANPASAYVPTVSIATVATL